MEKTMRTTKYLSVYQDLRDAILSGKYLRGSFLPTEAELTQIYRVSHTTIRKAVAMLQDEGLIHIQQGRGTEVVSGESQIRPTAPQIYGGVAGVFSRYLSEGEAVASNSVVDTVPADLKTARALELEPGTPVYRIQWLKLLGEVPFSYVAAYVPRDLAPGLERFSGQVFALKQCLREHYRLFCTSTEETVSAATAKFLESNLLGVPVGAPLLTTCRTGRNGERVVKYSESYIRPDVCQLVVSMEGEPDYASASGRSEP